MNNKNKELYQREELDKLQEVSFTRHIDEFIRFFDSHRLLCERLSGIKPLKEENGNKYFISKESLGFAIKLILTFFYDNAHYLVNKSERKRIENEILELESKYINDAKYKEYVRCPPKPLTTEYIDYMWTYFYYIDICFKLSSEINEALQSTLMITTKDINKMINFTNYKPFFDNLYDFRKEVSESMSCFEYKHLSKHIYLIISYVYTYKTTISKKRYEQIKQLIDISQGYFLDRDTFRKLVFLQYDKFPSYEVDDLRKEEAVLRRVLFKILELVNISLSESNILPKIKRQVLIDKTLI